jgi:hypothetical protein
MAAAGVLNDTGVQKVITEQIWDLSAPFWRKKELRFGPINGRYELESPSGQQGRGMTLPGDGQQQASL